MRKIFLVILILNLSVILLWARENASAGEGEEVRSYSSRISWFITGSVLFFPEDNGLDSDPMPVLPSPGAGVFFPITKIFGIELTLDAYMTHYGYNYVLDRAVPNAIENRTARVIGFPFAIQAAWHIGLTPLLSLRAYGGPAADLRAVFVAAGLNKGLDDMEDIRRQTDSARSYFWSSGRWFMPVMGTGLDFSLSPRIKLGVDLRVWIPMYRIWTKENLPPIEGWRFGPGIRFTFG